MIVLVESLKDKIQSAQYRAILKANAEMIHLYYEVGKELLKNPSMAINSLIYWLKKLGFLHQQSKGFQQEI